MTLTNFFEKSRLGFDSNLFQPVLTLRQSLGLIRQDFAYKAAC
jgi:hypothetical protein